MSDFREYLNEATQPKDVKSDLEGIVTYLSKNKSKFKDGEKFLKQAKNFLKNKKLSDKDIKLIDDLKSNIDWMKG